jgi:hypothetical protein
MANIRAMIPSTPRDTPSPIPAFIPVDIPVSLGGRAAVDNVGDGAPFESVVTGGDEPVGDRTEGDGVEVDGADPAWADLDGSAAEVSDELFAVAGTSRATLNPTTAIAPTLDDADKVVVVIFQSLGDMKFVEAYVMTMPFDTWETQSPFTGPLVARMLE